MKRMKKLVLCIFMALLIVGGVSAETAVVPENVEQFSDVPIGHYAYDDILMLRGLKITDGMGNNTYGMGLTLKRGEFVKMLATLLEWEIPTIVTNPSYEDCEIGAWYTPYIEAALKNSAILPASRFYPGDKITREEMAVMLIRSLGYEGLSRSLVVKNSKNPFTDVTLQSRPNTLGHIIMAYDFGIINGVTTTTFKPQGFATREQAAAMMMRLYRRSKPESTENTSQTISFYALSSYSQVNYVDKFQRLSCGWSRMEYDVTDGAFLNTTSKNGNTFNIPSGVSSMLEVVGNTNTQLNLSIYMDTIQSVTLSSGEKVLVVDKVLLDPVERTKAVDSIINEVSRVYLETGDSPFTGVTIDFEGFKSEQYVEPLNDFLRELREKINALPNLQAPLLIYVCVPPRGPEGQDYFKGYDYKTIGEIADKIILMAHDYEPLTLPKYQMDSGNINTPLTPIDMIYYALKSASDSDKGVQMLDKVAVAINFDTARWTVKDGKVVNSNVLRSDYPSIYKRLIDPSTERYYSEIYQNPYIKYISDDSTEVVWYEDERSINAKLMLAKMFGITSVSYWRLGVIPNYENVNGDEIYFNAFDSLPSK